MFCEKCGSPVGDTDSFCMNCGHPIAPAQGDGGAGQEPQPVTEAAAETAAQPEAEQPAAETAAQPEAEQPAAETAAQPEAEQPAAETAVQPEAEQPAAEAATQSEAEKPAAEAATQSEAEKPAAEAATQSEETPTVAETPVQPEQSVYATPSYAGGASVYTPPVTPDMGNAAPEKKGSKLPVVVLIVAAVAILAAAVCALNVKAMSNFVHKTFNSPEEYYQWVEKEAAKDIVLSAGQIYNDAVLEMTNLYDKSVSGEVGIELGEEGSDLLSLAGLAGVDLSWLESGSVSFEVSNKTGYVTADVSASLNKNQLASLSLIVDVDDQMFYVQVPELSKNWLAFNENITEFGEDEADEYFDAMEELEKNAKAFPTQKEIEDLTEKYVNIVIDCIDKVDMDTVTVEAEGISQKCTALKVTLNQKTLEKISKALSKAVEKDKDIEKLFDKIAPLIDEDADPEEMYEDFLDSFLDAMEELPDSIDEDSKVVMTVYVDSKGRICGRDAKWKDYWGDEIKISTMMPQKGKKFGYEFSYDYDDVKVKVTGSGTRSRDKLTGDFVAKYNGTKLINIAVTNFDIASAKKGYLNGKFSITPDKTLVKTMGYSDSSAMSWLQDLRVDLTFEMAQGSTKVQVGADLDGDKLGTVTVSASQGKGKKPSIPTSNVMEMEDESDFMEYLADADWDSILKKLEKSKVPDSIIDDLEDYIDMLEDGFY